MKQLKTMTMAALLLASSSTYAQWSAGVIGIGQSNPYIAGDTGVDVFPIIAYEGEKLVWRGPFLDYYVLGKQKADTSLSLNIALAANDFETEGDTRLVGIEDRDNSIMAGFTFNQAVGTGTLRFSAQTEVTNKHSGQRATLGWQKAVFKDSQFKWQVTAGVEIEYLSANYADYYFGVSQTEQQNSAFEAYQVGSVLQPSVTLGGYYSFNRKWQLVANVGLQMLDSAITDSPIIDGDTVVDAFVGVVYNF